MSKDGASPAVRQGYGLPPQAARSLARFHVQPYIAAMPDTDAHAARLRKLTFRASRRGFLEADLILGPFARSHIAELEPDTLDEFEHLLDVPDQDLYGWIVGLKPTPPEWETPLVQRLRAFRLEAFAARTATA